MTEREIKLPVDDVDRIRRKLSERGWRASGVRRFERNTLYDTAAGELQAAGRLLRVREVEDRGLLTAKEPQRLEGGHQVREEFETAVAEPAALKRILEGLGYEPSWIYEKRRTRFEREADAGVIELDETPVGDYLELEGEADWIDRTAVELGFARDDYLAVSYRILFERWREQAGRVDLRDMVFS